MINQEKVTPDVRPSPRLRLDYLDGLRGLAALYVVAFHAYETSGNGSYGGMHTNLPGMLVKSLYWLSCGNVAVTVFIALSGYCLMLPLAKSDSLQGGFSGYIQRRARRILPPYFAALLLSALIIVLVPAMNRKQGVYWDQCLPAFTSISIISHLLLVHNFTDSVSRINYPLWSVATEWQIYFVFPLLMLPLWRRFGLFPMVALMIFGSVGQHYVFHGRFDSPAPQYIGVFAMGAAGALINFSPRYAAVLKRLPWKIISAVSCGCVLLAMTFKPTLVYGRGHLSDTFIGFATTSMLIYCTSQLMAGHEKREGFVLKILQFAPLVWLGSFSYSLYLMHAPILALFHILLRKTSLEPIPMLAILLTVGVALSLLGAYAFHLVFERRFMTKPKVRAAA